MARETHLLFSLCLITVVFPLIRIPLIDLSITAPLFFILYGEVIMRSKLPRTSLKRWKFVLFFLAFGLLFSFIANTVDFDAAFSSDLLLTIRFIYWIVIIAVVTIIFSQTDNPELYCKIIGWTIFALAGYRLFEIVTGREGLIGENSYGFLFSCFFTYGAFLVLIEKRGIQLLACCGLAVLLITIVLNGSRSSWVSICLQLVFVSWMLLSAPRTRLRVAVLLLALGAAAAVFMLLSPASVEEQITERAKTFSSLERDKSFQVRKAMVRKGWALFKDSPVFGVGPGRFTRSMAVFEVSDVLRGVPKKNLNQRSSHNSYVQMLAETGLVGSIPLFVLMATLTLRGFASSRRLSLRRQLWAPIVFTSLVGMCIHMWTVSGLTGALAWVVFGLVAGMISWEQRALQQLRARQQAMMHSMQLRERRPRSEPDGPDQARS